MVNAAQIIAAIREMAAQKHLSPEEMTDLIRIRILPVPVAGITS
jgi:hypothetical protein